MMQYRSGKWSQGICWCLLSVVLAFAVVPLGAAQVSESPLLMKGKKTLYQRVLTRLGTVLRAAPERNAEEIAKVPPFTIYFVYARRKIDGLEWLKVGSSSHGNPSGWIEAEHLVEWKQMLVGLFTRPGFRYPALLFRDRKTIKEVLESEIGASIAARYRKNLGSETSESPVVAVEPETYIDPLKHFYLLPILDYFVADDDFATKALKVAVVNANARQRVVVPAADNKKEPLADFKIAITFVIDTTLSMGPYINQTRDAIRRICAKTQSTKWRDRFNFSIVAFRDNLKARPELAYTWKQIAGFKDGRDCQVLLREAQTMREAQVSSKDYSEDALAGVNAALTEQDWKPFGGRYIVLITDASARSGSNRYSTTGLNAKQVNSKAKSQGVAVLTLHLLTPQGQHDHETAANQYRNLSRWTNLSPLYYPLPAGAENFGVQVEHLADALIGHLGKEAAQYMESVRRNRQVITHRAVDIEHLGLAMRLAYLGRRQEIAAPEVFEAWVAERNTQDRRKLALETRVLLSKDQLSDLQVALRQIIEAGDLTDLSPEDFFTQMRKLLIVAQRDSTQLAQVKTLGDPVVLGEYLEGLPYRSVLTSIDQQSWLAMGAGERQELFDDIEAKIQLYQDIHDSNDLWIKLNDSNVKGDEVYPISLIDLP